MTDVSVNGGGHGHNSCSDVIRDEVVGEGTSIGEGVSGADQDKAVEAELLAHLSGLLLLGRGPKVIVRPAEVIETTEISEGLERLLGNLNDLLAHEAS